MSAYVAIVEGLDELSDLENIPEKYLRAARMAVNRTTDRTRTASARAIREQINFPARYLDPAGGRLEVTQRATNANLEAKITGRTRATSLARFSSGAEPGQPGVNLQIKAGGGARFLPRAFAIRLRAGTANLDTKSNLGLAVRTANGEKPRGAYKPKQIGENLWLLYGPAVAQVFKTVRGDVSPDALDFLESEFNRNMKRENL